MKKKMGFFLVAIMLMSCVLGGCQSTGGSGGSGTKIFFSVIEGGEYYETWAAMAQDKAAELGVQLDVEYADNSIEIQDEQIRRAVSEGYDAIMCSVVSTDTVNVIKEIAGDIPIVFVNNAPDENMLVADKDIYVASDEYMAGQYQAEYVLEQLSGKDEINVVVLKGPSGSSATKGRTGGAKRVFEASGKKINYVFEDYANFNPDQAQEIYSIFLKTNPSVDCVLCNNDNMTLGAIAAYEEAGVNMSDILFLGVDASGDGCQSIVDGKMAFTVFQSSQGQAEAAVEAANRLANGQSIQGMEGATEDSKYVYIPFEKVDAGNVADYMN